MLAASSPETRSTLRVTVSATRCRSAPIVPLAEVASSGEVESAIST